MKRVEMKRVILETPYASRTAEKVENNLRYAGMCARDCLMKGEAPFASHLVYTQPGILRDNIPEERNLGIEAGFAWRPKADKTVVYIDRGISAGMKYGIEHAKHISQRVEYRTLYPLQIITLTGQSGVGKSTIAKKIVELRREIKFVCSLTTRGSRPSDLQGEYAFSCGKEKLYECNRQNELLWLVEAYGNLYGTSKTSVDAAIYARNPSLMLLAPEVLTTLREYVDDRPGASIVSFYILAPAEEIKFRLEKRGDDADAVKRRIKENKKWDDKAKNSGLPYIFINNGKRDNGESAAREILKYGGLGK